MTPLIRELVALDETVALGHMWFDIGTVPHYEFAWSELYGSRLPFENCAICGYDMIGHKFLVLARQALDKPYLIAVSAWALMPDHYTKTPLFVLYLEPGGCKIVSTEGEPTITREQAAPIVGTLAAFLAKTHPVGYTATVKRNSILNRQRKAKGKPPIAYDWHTIKIEPPAQKGASLGGTHVSPRQHERRGHFRNTRSGKRVFVRQCVVGRADRGAVFKDYQA